MKNNNVCNGDVVTCKKCFRKYIINVDNIDDSLKFELLRYPRVSKSIYNFKINLKSRSTQAFRHQ